MFLQTLLEGVVQRKQSCYRLRGASRVRYLSRAGRGRGRGTGRGRRAGRARSSGGGSSTSSRGSGRFHNFL